MRIMVLSLLFLMVCVFGVMAEYQEDEGRRMSKVCAGCHGTNGESPGELIPILGGQNAEFIAASLEGFKNKSRSGEMMQKLSKAYSEKEMLIVGTFFAKQKWVNSPYTAAAMKAASGKKLIENCVDCHGNMGEGMDGNPRISGQSPAYLLHALMEYKNGQRGETDMDGLLDDYSAADLEALAAYYANLR